MKKSKYLISLIVLGVSLSSCSLFTSYTVDDVLSFISTYGVDTSLWEGVKMEFADTYYDKWDNNIEESKVSSSFKMSCVDESYTALIDVSMNISSKNNITGDKEVTKITYSIYIEESSLNIYIKSSGDDKYEEINSYEYTYSFDSFLYYAFVYASLIPAAIYSLSYYLNLDDSNLKVSIRERSNSTYLSVNASYTQKYVTYKESFKESYSLTYDSLYNLSSYSIYGSYKTSFDDGDYTNEVIQINASTYDKSISLPKWLES